MSSSRTQLHATPAGVTFAEFGDARCVARRHATTSRVSRRRAWSRPRPPEWSTRSPNRAGAQ